MYGVASGVVRPGYVQIIAYDKRFFGRRTVSLRGFIFFVALLHRYVTVGVNSRVGCRI